MIVDDDHVADLVRDSIQRSRDRLARSMERRLWGDEDDWARCGPVFRRRVRRKLFGIIPLWKVWVEKVNPHYDPSKEQYADGYWPGRAAQR